MNIFKLVGTVFVDTDAANQSLQKTDKQAGNVGTSLLNGAKKAGKFALALGAATAAGGAALMGMAQKAAGVTDNIDKMSQKIGISRQAYQELDFITSQCGASVDGLKVGMKTLTNQMQMAEQGSSTAKAAFDALGLSWTDSTGKLKDQETMMWEAFSALQACEDQTQKAALASDLFGRAGTELMPMLNGASGSIEEMKQKAHELGLVLSDDAIDAGVVFTDTLDQAKRSASALVAQVGVKVMPIIQKGLDYLIENMPEIQKRAEKAFTVLSAVVSTTVKVFVSLVKWVEKNKTLLKALAIVVGTLTAAYKLYKVAQAVKIAMDKLEVTSLRALISAQLASAAATLTAMAPYIAIVAAIAAVIAIIVLCIKHWDKIKEAVGNAMDFIGEKVQNGVEKVKGLFEKIINFVKENWQSLLLLLVNPIAGAFKLLYDNCEGFRNFVDGFISRIKELFSGGFDAVKRAIVNPIKNAISNVINSLASLPEKASEKLEALKNKFKSKLESLQELVKNIVAKIKGFFNFSFSVPKIKLPHFAIKPKGWDIGDLLKGSIPKLSIDWYAKAMDKGMILDEPTIFGINSKGQFMGAGDAGSETVVGTKSLMSMIGDAVRSQNNDKILAAILQEMKTLNGNLYNTIASALREMGIEFDERELGRLVKKYA